MKNEGRIGFLKYERGFVVKAWRMGILGIDEMWRLTAEIDEELNKLL